MKISISYLTILLIVKDEKALSLKDHKVVYNGKPIFKQSTAGGHILFQRK